MTVENEIAFWRLYFAELLRTQGITEQISARADALFDAFWLKGGVVYPETVPVLDWFAARGYRMGVISDTFPSLRLTLEAVGLDQYFDCFVCSDQVGVMKPEPLIYQTALNLLGVSAAGEPVCGRLRRGGGRRARAGVYGVSRLPGLSRKEVGYRLP